MEYNIACHWASCGEKKIEANSLEAAMKEAKELWPTDMDNIEYIDGSWEVNKEVSIELNEKATIDCGDAISEISDFLSEASGEAIVEIYNLVSDKKDAKYIGDNMIEVSGD